MCSSITTFSGAVTLHSDSVWTCMGQSASSIVASDTDRDHRKKSLNASVCVCEYVGMCPSKHAAFVSHVLCCCSTGVSDRMCLCRVVWVPQKGCKGVMS